LGLFPELLGVGGVQEAGRMTAAALNHIAAQRKWATDFLSLNDPPSEGELEVAERKVRFHGFEREKLKFTASALHAAFMERPRVVLAMHPHLAPPAALARSVSSDARMMVMSHGVEVWTRLPAVRHRSLLRADMVLAPSRYTAEKLQTVQGVASDKIRVSPWPLNPMIMALATQPSALAIPLSWPSDPGARVVLTVGRWAASERYKGVDELIRAVAQLSNAFPDLHLVAVGGGDDLPRLRKEAADAGLHGHAHFLEGLSREEIAACYSSAEIFALPSAGEGFGLVFLEAMAFGRPVIGAAFGGTLDVIEDGVNGLLVSPHDAKSLANTLARLLQDSGLRDRLGRAGAERVRLRHSFDAFELALAAILELCGMDSATLE